MLTSMTSKFSLDLANRFAGIESCTYWKLCYQILYDFINVSVVIIFLWKGAMHGRVIINNYSFAKQNSYVSLNLFNLFINKLLTFIGSRIVGEDCYGNGKCYRGVEHLVENY